jgi:tRNA/tmRNA/rRNA uracil-C5-methylase (TrmA/RlmC/RlmD family)
MKRCAGQQGKEAAGRKKKKNKTGPLTLTDPSLRYIDAPTQTPIVDDAKAFFRSISLPFEVHCGPVTGWRSVAKLAVRGCKESGVITKNCIGLFAPKSHDIIPCLHSIVHHDSINFVVRLLEDVLIEKCVSGYREDTGTGLLRYLLFTVELSSGKVQITFVLNCNVGDEASLEVIKSVCGSFLVGKKKKKRIHSFWVHFNPASRHNNAIMGRQENSWLCIYGDDMLREAIYLDDNLESCEYFRLKKYLLILLYNLVFSHACSFKTVPIIEASALFSAKCFQTGESVRVF